MAKGIARFSLEGKRAVVTGAGRGIGRTLALGLAEAGASVALASRSLCEVEAVAGEIKAEGGRAFAFALDVADPSGCRAVIRHAAGALGGLDILVNNAGTEEVCPSLDVEPELFDRILDVNLKGAFFAAQAAARAMVASGEGGAIVNLCSLSAHVGIPTAVPYGSSKTGLLGMTRALAAEWAPLGIRVNAISPGYFRTAMTEPFYADATWEKAMLAKIPLARFGRLDDLVGAAVFLASNAAAYVTGQCLAIDGGTLASI